MREGRHRKGESKGYNVTFSRGNRRAYIKARLERDGEYDLLTRVRAGGMTAKAIGSLMGGRSGWPGIYARSGTAGLCEALGPRKPPSLAGRPCPRPQ